ncbi:deazaflavin-dependent oxidoreductase (nitroreductase family) [Agromyces flavus]|uniref:Deazaflavin-dependent oxidoreductase (Nitroreductase family) n=1 Tax=Agromyces flavus TaxID=589382 RepID=A0A1H1SPV2_9MICO|nr:nitroreductase family deazaflavin-dependent oxidoreductase [Agromyces flavus]MCP2369303.1 deazaflavin-dependent oxidoreductase (nitroreductase family) [Agromyces flavus]GGI48516.1 hypothetical protein GCM10010932_32040 [Agromyces flavus]SDS49941.1 deazaflavin-dependent oxidoreductase, nitroreductase family [Agromyces flavus]
MPIPKPGPVAAWFNRVPSYLYRAHLGAIMGPRFVMLTTVGRRSRAVRRTVVEVFARGETPGRDGLPVLHVVASRGARSDWYANATSMGRIRVDWMDRRGRADVHRLDIDDRVHLLTRYASDHPKAAAMLVKGVLDEPSTAGTEQMRRLAAAVRALRLEPAGGAITDGSTADSDVAPRR